MEEKMKLNWKKILLWTGISLAFMALLLITLGAIYLAYQYKLNLDATHIQLVAMSKELAREQDKVEVFQRCFDYINSGKLLPDVVQKGNEYILTYDCK
jgi:hypothetical protein